MARQGMEMDAESERGERPEGPALAALTPPFHLVLFNPEIPQNTGNVGRLCAYTGCRLHLIRPLGFTVTDRHLKRSGMDYWKALDVHYHDDWEAYLASPLSPAEERLWMFTTRGERSFWDASFAEGEALLFGNEGHGCPDWLHARIPPERKLSLPRFSAHPLRSLNLATAVGIATYEALRQSRRRPPAE